MKINLLIWLFVFFGSHVSGQISLVRDINNGASTTGSYPNDLTVLGGFVYYSASDGVTGTELWRSNGTALGTTQVKDINPGDGSSSPTQFTLIGSFIYFRASDGDNGAELWRTDGTKAGTIMVADINPGINSSSPGQFKVINSTTIYFTSNNGTNGTELWKTDVTTKATSMVADINVGPSNSSPQYILLVSGTTVYFAANDGSSGQELWKSDGTAIGTVRIKDINTTGSSNPAYLTLLGSTVYFAASDGAEDVSHDGNELWSTNGTSAGTQIVLDINPTTDSYPTGIVAMGSSIYFSADDGTGTYGNELWASNGTAIGTQIVSEMSGVAPFPTGSYPSNFKVIGSNLYFTATSNNNGTELYRTTGGVGAHVLININTAAGVGSYPYNLTDIGGTLYFTADDGVKGYELWKYNGSTSSLVDISLNAPSSYPSNYTLLGTTVFMSADNGSGTELWTISTSGSTATQVVDLIIGTGASNPSNFVYNGAGITYFRADNGTSGTELWKTDGTAVNTTMVKDINLSGSSSPNNLVMVGSTLYFTAYDGTDTELWKSDGTLPGTVKFDIIAGAGSSSPSQLFALNSTTLLFQATDGVNGFELWYCVNGGSPLMVENINASPAASSYPSGFKLFGSFAYFSADDGVNGTELWRISTTTVNAANNSLFANINAAAASSSPLNLFPISTTILYFSANNGSGNELWSTNGVTTALVKDINTTTGTAGSNPYPVAALGSSLLFNASDGVIGNELWKSDGTLAGTVMLKEINTSSSNLGNSVLNSPLVTINYNSKVFFLAYDATNGYEMWSTDGTPAGTTLFKDINPGAGNSVFSYPVVSGTSLYFLASDGTGNNVFVTDGTRTCATIMVPPFSGGQTAGASLLTAMGSKMIFAMTGQGYDREPFILDPSLVTLPVNTAINTHPSTQIITTGSPVTFIVAAAGTNLIYQWQKNSVDIPSATSASYNIAAVAGSDAAQYRCNVTGTCGNLSSNQATLTVFAAQPTAQPTALVFSSLATTSMTTSFTDATGAPSGYLALRNATNLPTEVPVDGTTYTAGAAFGTSTVVSIGASLTFNNTGLLGSTVYYYAIYAYNGSTNTLNYLTTSPLTGSRTTLNIEPTNQPTALLFSNVAATSLTLSWTASDAARYIVVRKAGSASTDLPVDGIVYPEGSTNGTSIVVYTGTIPTFNDTGLNEGTDYYYSLYAFNGTGGANNYKVTSPLMGNQTTLVTAPTSQPTGLVFSNRTFTSVDYSFTSSGAANYLVLRKQGSAPSEVSVNATSYTVGALLGTATVVSAGSSTSGTDSGLTAGTAYFYVVFAFNGTGASATYLTTAPLSGNTSTLSIDTTPPTFTNSSTNPVSGLPFLVSVKVEDLESGVNASTVKLEHRSISSGVGTFTSKSMTLNNANSRFEVEIPANEIGDQGVEYKIKATNTQGLEGTSSDYKGLNVFQSGISLPQIPAGSAQTDYRIIAIPITLSSNKGNDVFEELGAVDVNKWRMYRYENLATTEITSLASLTVEPGKGYWLISKSAVTISTGQGTAVDATSVTPFTINLVNGWNQIGNPYLFNLIWSDVNTANGTNLTLRTYNAGFNNDTKLDKFEGGFVQVASPISLKMPTAKNASGGRAAELPTVVKNSIDMPEWSVSLELKNGTMQTPFGGVGMSPDASISYDEHDDFTMPRFLDYLELNHSKKIYGMTYTKDIIPTTENYEWQFTVESNIEATTKMTWDNSYFGKNDKHIVLWDVEEKRSVDMREANQYSFKGNVAKTFQVFFGNKEYVQEKTALKSLIIHSLSPNPTEGETKIAFTLAGTEESFVQVKVMSLLGQSISTAFEGYLAGGFHEVTWSGKDSQGNKPAQGVYLVEVIQGKERGSKRLIVK